MNPVQATFAGIKDVFVSKIGVAVPVVTITVVPDAVTVAQGSILGYTVTATNTTASQQCFNYWENVNLPGGALYPVNASLINPVPRLCLNSGASQVVHLTHGVPLSAPIGAYVFNAYDGIYPVSFRVVVDSDSFNFNVTPPVVAPGQNLHNSWRLIENGFRK